MDPFDFYSLHKKLKEENDFKLIYFILCAYKSRFDVSLSPKSGKLKKLINYISEYAEIGIHPSYYSYNDFKKFWEECLDLSAITIKKAIKSRQHFLRFKLPNTFENLSKAGIIEDYTMGYASQVGFRASICTPFDFYNLEKNIEARLKIFPFCVMDVTLADYLKLSNIEKREVIDELLNAVKNVNGTFINIWHDRTFSNLNQYEGMREIYIDLVKNFKS